MIRLLWTFYKNFFLLSIISTLCCAALLYKYGIAIFVGIFWLKLILMFLSFYFINFYKKQEYYYYQNFGISKKLLWSATLTADFLLFLFVIIVTYKIK